MKSIRGHLIVLPSSYDEDAPRRHRRGSRAESFSGLTTVYTFKDSADRRFQSPSRPPGGPASGTHNPGLTVDGDDLDDARSRGPESFSRRPRTRLTIRSAPSTMGRGGGGHLAAAIGRPRRIGCKQRQQRLVIAGLEARSMKVSQHGGASPASPRIEALALAAHPLARAMDDLPASRVALAEDLRDSAG